MAYLIRQLDIRDKGSAVSEFQKIDATAAGIEIMSLKSIQIFLKIKNVNNKAANILKQEMLARGGDVVLSKKALYESEGFTDVILFGNQKSLLSLADKIRMQPFGLKELGLEITAHLKNNKAAKVLHISNKKFLIENKPLMMGVLNITPDSFYDGGRYLQEDAIKKKVEKIVSEGADIIDVGGMSTRPFSQPVDTEEEARRVIPVIKHIANNYDIIISVDTYRSEIAAKAIENGADMVNDISGMGFDPSMKKIVKDYASSIVIMHIKGMPADMQVNPVYKDIVGEIYDYFETRTKDAIAFGIKKDKIIIDVGLGFGKTIENNFEIIKNIHSFTYLGFPLMIGASRKSFTGSQFDTSPEERLEASLAVASYSALHGVNIFRVHDVEKTIKAIQMIELIKNA